MKALLVLVSITFVSAFSFGREEVSGLVTTAICKDVASKYSQHMIGNGDQPAWLVCRQTGIFARVNDYYTLLLPARKGRLSCTATIGSSAYGHVKATSNCRVVQKH